MTGYQSKHLASQTTEIAELKNSLAQAKQKKTLRDEFAMAALPSVMQKHEFIISRSMVEDAYLIADAMIKERNQ